MESAWLWLMGGVLLAIAEILVPGIFLIWLGMAAIVTGAVALALPLAPPTEFGLFALTACVTVLTGRSVMQRLPVISDDPLLNERTARLIGRKVLVVEPFIGGAGRVRVGDGVWPATGADAPAGAWVEVTGADGSRLRVEPIAP